MCPDPQSIQRFFDCISTIFILLIILTNFFFFIRRPREQANHQKLVRDRDRDGKRRPWSLQSGEPDSLKPGAGTGPLARPQTATREKQPCRGLGLPGWVPVGLWQAWVEYLGVLTWGPHGQCQDSGHSQQQAAPVPHPRPHGCHRDLQSHSFTGRCS